MYRHYLGCLFALLCCASMLLVPGRAGAKETANEPFSAMRVRRIKPTPTGQLVLKAAGGSPIRLADYRGKAVLVEFFIAN